MHGQAMARECLVKCGVLPREDEEKEENGDEEEHASVATKNLVDRSFADDEDALRALRARVVDAGAQAAREIESLLTSSSKSLDGPFLGGKSPDAADAYLVAALWVAHNLLTSGVAVLRRGARRPARRVRSRRWARPRRSRTCARGRRGRRGARSCAPRTP